jgi:hypothetical protein
MSAVPSIRRRRRIAIVSVVGSQTIADAGGEVADPVGAAVELAMRPPYAGVDDIRMHAGTVPGRDEPAVERERALIDAIEAPRWRLLHGCSASETESTEH